MRAQGGVPVAVPTAWLNPWGSDQVKLQIQSGSVGEWIALVGVTT